MGEIRVAIAGVGNCASSLVQGIEYYRNNGTKQIIGLMHENLGGYLPQDLKFVVAFDIDKRKVGKDISEAIFECPNCTKTIYRNVPKLGATVMMGPVLDGFAEHMKNYSEERRFVVSDEKPCDVAAELKKHKVDVLINYMPVGSEKATKFYAEAALEAGVAFVNCMPVFIASDETWAKKFEDRGIPIVGDDIKSQLGATIVHRVLTKLFQDRGVIVDRTYQLNTGGNTDFLNMLEKDRLKSKKISKTEAVQSQLDIPLAPDNIHIGPCNRNYVPTYIVLVGLHIPQPVGEAEVMDNIVVIRVIIVLVLFYKVLYYQPYLEYGLTVLPRISKPPLDRDYQREYPVYSARLHP